MFSKIKSNIRKTLEFDYLILDEMKSCLSLFIKQKDKLTSETARQ